MVTSDAITHDNLSMHNKVRTYATVRKIFSRINYLTTSFFTIIHHGVAPNK